MKSVYPEVTQGRPFLYLTIQNEDLNSIESTGDTVVKVFRVTKVNDINSATDSFVPATATSYTPIKQVKNRFTIVLDNSILGQDGGRFIAAFYYKGTYITASYFIYSKPHVSMQVFADA